MRSERGRENSQKLSETSLAKASIRDPEQWEFLASLPCMESKNKRTRNELKGMEFILRMTNHERD